MDWRHRNRRSSKGEGPGVLRPLGTSREAQLRGGEPGLRPTDRRGGRAPRGRTPRRASVHGRAPPPPPQALGSVAVPERRDSQAFENHGASSSWADTDPQRIHKDKTETNPSTSGRVATRAPPGSRDAGVLGPSCLRVTQEQGSWRTTPASRGQGRWRPLRTRAQERGRGGGRSKSGKGAKSSRLRGTEQVLAVFSRKLS